MNVAKICTENVTVMCISNSVIDNRYVFRRTVTHIMPPLRHLTHIFNGIVAFGVVFMNLLTIYSVKTACLVV